MVRGSGRRYSARSRRMPLSRWAGIEIARPFPGGDGEVDPVVLRRHAELLRAAPRDRADIGVLLAVLLHHQALGGVDLGDRIGDFEVEQGGGAHQALGMLGALEDHAVIGALAFEHGARVMQAMGEHVDLRLRPRHQLAVEPDHAFHLIEGHRHGRSSGVGPCCSGCPLLCVALQVSIWLQPDESAIARRMQRSPNSRRRARSFRQHAASW